MTTTAMLAALFCPLACRNSEQPNIPPPSADSQPALSSPLQTPNGASTPQAPHNGQLIPIPDTPGYVEMIWHGSTAQLQLYFVDDISRPLLGIQHPVVWITTDTGPLELALQDCDDPDWTDTCYQVLLQHPGNRNEFTCVLRFELDNNRCRVLLPTLHLTHPSPESQPPKSVKITNPGTTQS